MTTETAPRSRTTLAKGGLTTRGQVRRAEADAITTAITTIARDKLGLETLEARNRDCLDFSDQAVWNLEAALRAAYRAGQLNAGA